ncbi:MAG: WD40 repeat domain-containing protein [Fimbriiglobus sp.]
MQRIAIDEDRNTPDDEIRGLKFSQDGRYLVGTIGVEEDRLPFRYDLERDRLLSLDHLEAEDEIARLDDAPAPAWDAHGEVLIEYLVDAMGELAVRVVDLWAKPPRIEYLPVTPSAFSLTGESGSFFLATKLEDRDVVLQYALEDDEGYEDLSVSGTWNLSFDEGTAVVIAASANGDWLAIGSDAGAVELIHLKQRFAAQTLIPLGGESRIDGLEFSPEQNSLLIFTANTAIVWQFAEGDFYVLETWAKVEHGAFLPSGGVLTCGLDGDLIFYDPDSLQETKRLNFDTGPLLCIAVSADGLTAAAGTAQGEVWLVDLE